MVGEGVQRQRQRSSNRDTLLEGHTMAVTERASTACTEERVVGAPDGVAERNPKGGCIACADAAAWEACREECATLRLLAALTGVSIARRTTLTWDSWTALVMGRVSSKLRRARWQNNPQLDGPPQPSQALSDQSLTMLTAAWCTARHASNTTPAIPPICWIIFYSPMKKSDANRSVVSCKANTHRCQNTHRCENNQEVNTSWSQSDQKFILLCSAPFTVSTENRN